MKNKYRIYIFLTSLYLIASIYYLYFVLNFDCDGFGCLSILFFTGPFIIAFITSFIILLIKTYNYSFKNQLDANQINTKMNSLMFKLGIPFWMFTLILIIIIVNYITI